MGCANVLCVMHGRRGCEVEKQAVIPFGKDCDPVRLPEGTVWSGRKSASFGGREDRIQIPAHPLSAV